MGNTGLGSAKEEDSRTLECFIPSPQVFETSFTCSRTKRKVSGAEQQVLGRGFPEDCMERGHPFPCRHTHTNTFKLQRLYSSGFPTSTMTSSGFLSSLQASIEIAPAYFCLVKERATPNSAYVVMEISGYQVGCM